MTHPTGYRGPHDPGRDQAQACTCPDGGGHWQCIDQVVYGPCTADQCPGSCVQENPCDCTATVHTPGMHGTPWENE